ncbi:MAG TPA: hypothetical protein DCM86_20295 [Verrucomicrobiales bacterium]|nr:hypothetical protein [Verrucomicrobiales bacterium]
MSFFTPIAFLFALALPVVVAMYLLKRRRITRLTSSTLLWRRFLAESQANAPFQRLRAHWLMLLQLLLLALVVLALARPYFKGSARQSRLRVVVLDGSASMQSTDVAPSRFEAARAEAAGWIEGLRGEERMMILLAGASTEVRQSPTTDKGALHRALDACRPSDSSTRLVEALQTAAAFTYEKRGEEEVTTGEIHLFSDGASTDLGALASKNLPLVYHRVGRRAHNLGIISLDLRANPENAAERAVFVGVSNPSPEAWNTQVELRFNGQLLEVKPIQVPATNTAAVTFLARQETDGLFTATLAGTDDLAVDDQASLYSPLPRPVNVLLVTRGNRFLERALAGLPGVRLRLAGPGPLPEGSHDLVILDDVAPPVWPTGNLLAIRVAGTNWFEGLQAEENPSIVDWNQTHPVLRHVSFDTVDVAEALLPKSATWGVPLIQSQLHPLAVAGERDHRRVLWLGFDPLKSSWPLRISFPIFIANAVEWLGPGASGSHGLGLHPGEVLHHAFSAPVPSAVVIHPDGRREELATSPGGREVVFGGTSTRGVYRLEGGTNQLTFCVNLLDAAESNTTPLEELPLGRYAATAASSVTTAGRELWRWGAAAALVLLLLEWWYFHTRTA